MKKLLLLAVASVSMFIQGTNSRERIKKHLYEEFAPYVEEDSREGFEEAVAELLTEDNDLQLLEEPMQIHLRDSNAYVLVTGSNSIYNGTPVVYEAGYLRGRVNSWGYALLISYIDKRKGGVTTSYIYLTKAVNLTPQA